MFRYVIFRKGSNAANQPMEFGWVPVATMLAKNRDLAVQAALDDGVSCYGNQILEARPWSRCRPADFVAAVQADEGRKAESQAMTP